MTPQGVAIHGPDARHGLRLVVVDLETLKTAIRDALAEMRFSLTPPDFYSQTCLPPGLSRRAFLDAIRRGELPARAAGKARFVARADYEAFVTKTPPVRMRLSRQAAPANDARAVVRASQGK